MVAECSTLGAHEVPGSRLLEVGSVDPPWQVTGERGAEAVPPQVEEAEVELSAFEELAAPAGAALVAEVLRSSVLHQEDELSRIRSMERCSLSFVMAKARARADAGLAGLEDGSLHLWLVLLCPSKRRT